MAAPGEEGEEDLLRQVLYLLSDIAVRAEERAASQQSPRHARLDDWSQQRDQAREDAKPELKLCRAAFKACAKACPPADPPSSVDRVQCKTDAKNEYLMCKETCREDFQVTKDACRNRDHVCVEGCREDRDECKQPVIDQLATAVAACNTGPGGRSDDIQECHNLYGGGTPELDICIDQAQVEAFQCRDTAHEAAKPGFQACRAAFRICAEGCPPAGV